MKVFHVSSYLHCGDELSPDQKPFQNEQHPFCCAMNAEGYMGLRRLFDGDVANPTIERKTGRRITKWLCESIFEYVRAHEFPALPSRITSVYLCDSLDAARRFRMKYRANSSATIFSAEIPDEAYPVFNMDLFTEAEESINQTNFSELSFDNAKRLARSYWNGCDLDCDSRELLYHKSFFLQEVVERP